MPRFARCPLGYFAWRPIGAAFEARIAEPAASTLNDFEALASLRQVTNQFTGINVVDDSATRHLYLKVCTGTAGPVPASASLAACGTVFPGNAKIDQRIYGRIGDQENAATVAAVTAIRPAPLNEFFTTKT